MELAQSNQITYENGEIVLKVSIGKETVWLTQKQLCDVFEKDQSVISRHINNIFKDNEVDKKSNMQKMHIANSDKPVSFYSLDIALAVGYRTNSAKAIKFRQWATAVLKEYIQNGYVLNTHKITEQRLLSIESDIEIIKSKIANDTLQTTQGIFYNGQVFDAYIFISDLIRGAKKELILIDNYIDDTTLTIFSKIPNIKVTIYSYTISKQLKLDYEKYKTQYNNITLKTFKNSHDRFMIIDNKELYHLGASLKDLGKKWFAFSKMDMGIVGILEKLKTK